MTSRSSSGPGARRLFVADPRVLADLGLAVEDLGDPDVRAAAVRHEHPEFEDALAAGLDQIDVGHGPMNPRLHFAMHEVVATQLWDGDPPEVWDTAVRLREAGYERHEILHMLGRAFSDQVWTALHDEQRYDQAEHIAALRALPGTWELERSASSAARKHDDGRKRARRKTREARRRNRRPK